MADEQNQPDNHLLTIAQSGDVPEHRINSASQAKQIWDELWLNDSGRSKKRSLVQGLTDGNPPYRQSDLVEAGRDYQCNVNWRIAEAYLNDASGAFFDLFNEAETYATIQCNHGSPDEQEKYSKILTKNFDWLLRGDGLRPYKKFQYVIQNSQREMTLYGAGPLMFQDEFDWLPDTILYRHLNVPEMTKSDTSEWELCAVQSSYSPDKLYYFISNPESAKAVGWDVEAVRMAIMNAQPEIQNGQYKTWEWYQQQLKDGSYIYGQNKVISLIHIFYREFPKNGESDGKISHVIIAADDTQVLDRTQSSDKQTPPFLFKKYDRYECWEECIHPLYYDRGSGGYHHGVTGMGVKMYSAMEYLNRLLCNQADKAFAPKMMFRPSSAAASEEFALQQFGDYGVLTENYDAVQMPTHGMLEEGLIFSREITSILSSNLGQYRQSAQPESGKEKTARQVTVEAQKEARLQKTTIERYYQQLDAVYAEMYRRAISPSLQKTMRNGERAHEFRKRCERDGCPKECWDKIEFIRATRVVGQGSEFLRQQSLDFLFATLMGMLPESGRNALISDMIASRAGYSAVERYMPKPRENQLPSEQFAWSISQVADMKTGTPAIPTDTQDPLVFATTFVDAGEKAVKTIPQGANPQEVAAFLDLAGQAAQVHINRLSQDPTREKIAKDLSRRVAQLGSIFDQLQQQIGESMQAEQEAQAEAMQRTQMFQSESAIKRAQAEQKMALSQRKSDQQYATKQAQAEQGMVIQDALAAHKIRLEALEAMNKQRNGNSKE